MQFPCKNTCSNYIIEHVFQFYLLIPIQFFAREYINQSRITSLLHQIETSFHDELNTTFLLYVLLNLGRLVMEELRGGWWRTRHLSRSLIYFSHINYIISITKKVYMYKLSNCYLYVVCWVFLFFVFFGLFWWILRPRYMNLYNLITWADLIQDKLGICTESHICKRTRRTFKSYFQIFISLSIFRGF